MFLFTHTAIMFRHPDINTPQIDRVGFILLILSAFGYSLFKRTRVLFVEPIVFYMISITVLALISVLDVPFDAQSWSQLANKFVVPFTMYYVAKIVFDNEQAVGHYFMFALLVTMYLVFISIMTVMNINILVIPQYILDPNLGPPEHVLRARGPFLSAVPNGTAISILGFTVLYWLKKKKAHPLFSSLMFILISISIFATMTRAIWLSYVFLVCCLSLNNRLFRLNKAKLALVLISLVSFFFLVKYAGLAKFASERLHDQENIVFRTNLYEAGFKIFSEKPLLGWGINRSPALLPKYLSDYKDNVLVHNSYLEILMELGIVGLIIYILIFLQCFKIGAQIYRSDNKNQTSLIDADFVFLWRVFLVVYLINGMFVVMNYQFVNAMIFTIAGIISVAEKRVDHSYKSEVWAYESQSI